MLCLLQFMRVREEFTRRVFAVAMTDSVHYMSDTKPFKDLVKVSIDFKIDLQLTYLHFGLSLHTYSYIR